MTKKMWYWVAFIVIGFIGVATEALGLGTEVFDILVNFVISALGVYTGYKLTKPAQPSEE